MATSNNRDVKLAVEIQATGEENLQRLAAEVRNLAKAGGDAAPQYVELANELDRVAAQARELSAFKTAAAGIDEATAASKRATAQAEQLALAYKDQNAATSIVRADQQAIQKSLNDTERAIASQVLQQKLLKQSLDAKKIDDEKFIADSRTMAEALVNLKAKLAGLTVDLREAKAATKESNGELTALAKSSLSASANAETLGASLRAQNAAMEQARAAGEKLGADFSDVAAAQERLEASLRGGVALLDANAAAARDLAAADALAAVEAKGLADAQERGAVAARSELAAIKESEAFMVRFASAQRETAAAVDKLTDDLDRQAATVRGTLITSMNAAAAAYESEQAAIAESIALSARLQAAQAELAESNRLVGLETRGLADERERATVAARSELAAIKDSTEFTKKFEQSQRETAAAVQALTDDLDRQAALVQGRLVKSLADAAAGYDKAEKEAEQAAVAANRVNGYFEKLASQRDVLKNAFGTTGVRSIQDIEQEMFKVSQALVTLRGEFAGGRISITDFERATSSAQVRLAALKTEIATIPGNRSAFDSLADSVNGMITKFGALAAAVATVGFAIAPVVKAFVSLESTRRILTQVTGSAEDAAQQIEFLRNVAQKSGQSFSEVSQTYAKFAASALQAGLSTEQVQQAFQNVSLAAGNLGLSSDQAKRALEALSQMASKGTVSMEELRQQLGDALPGILPLLAKELGLTGKELNALVESGGLLANEAIPAITQALTKLTPASGQVDGLTASWNRFKNIVLEAGTTLLEGPLGKAAGVLLTAFGGALRDVTVIAVGFSEAMNVTGKTLALVAAALTGNISSFKQFGEELDKIALDSAAKMAQFRDRAYQTSEAVDGVAKASTAAAPAVAAVGTATQAAGQAAAAATTQHAASATAITAVGTAATATGTQLFRLQADYAKNVEAAEEQVRISTKLVDARKSEGEALKTLAGLTGEDADAKGAAAEAAGILATALRQQSDDTTTLLNIRRAEYAAIQQQATAEGKLTAERQAALAVLDEKIKKEEANVEKATQAARASEMEAAAARLAAEALKDNAEQYDALVVAADEARASLEAVRIEVLAGRASTDELARAEIRLAEALGRVKDAAKDVEAAAARTALSRKADNELAAAGIKVKLEELKTVEAQAKADRDQAGALEAKIKIKELELKAARDGAQAKREEAQATIDLTQRILAEADAGRLQLTPEKRSEYETRIKNAEAKKLEADASVRSAERDRIEIQNLKDRAAGLNQVAAGFGAVTAAALAAENAALRYGSALKSTQYDKDKFALNSDGSRFTAGGQLKPPDDSGDWTFVSDVRASNVSGTTGKVAVNGQGYWVSAKAKAGGSLTATTSPSNNGRNGTSVFASQAKAQDIRNAGRVAGGYEVKFVIGGKPTSVVADSASSAESLIRDLQGAFRSAGGA